ncbi:MAG: helicase-related protein [Deltaproteobacteria bacterium]|nr:helicase-related protein [Deltaproteobacteria bacterium]
MPDDSVSQATNLEFSIGQIVVPLATPSISGAVTNIIPGKPENRYTVFIDGKIATYYASQLRASEPPTSPEFVPLKTFHAYLTALQLRHPGIANLYSLHAARVNFIPYQFKPVLKLIRSDRPRILIADEVGVGKTIEAGLIIRELQARRDINSVLVICPKPLVTERKWQDEMKRFDEYFEHLDGPKLRYCIKEADLDGCWPERFNKAILPFSIFNENTLKSLTTLDPNPHFDLVIVDEAHRLRNENTAIHRNVRFFCDNAEAVVFLTATPVQLGSDDLFVLLNMIRPDLIIDRPSFQHMAGPNPYINRAIELARGASDGWQERSAEALGEAADTAWGKAMLLDNPSFQRIENILKETEVSDAERIVFIREAEQLHTFSSIINRTRRRDIGNFTTRTPETVTVVFTDSQKELHDGVLDIQARILKRIHGNISLKFMMTTIRRQAASCLYGLKPFLEEILTRRLDDLEWDEADEAPDDLDIESVAQIEGEIRNIVSMVGKLDPYDPKLEALLKIINDKQKMSNNKILLFSSFRHTLKYILKRLIEQKLRVGLIQGNVPDEDRRDLRRRFSLPKENPEAIDTLLSSEVGCEGLDYQFCDCMVNYDLPWNPMRVEQRIGRIDRYGQKSKKVVIYNMITPGTVDFDIYKRCLWRIGIFHASVGGCEEILGRITTELHDVAENLKLTEEERNARLQQLSDNEIRVLKEQAELEEKQADLFGLRLPSKQTDEEVEKAASFWLSAWALQNVIRQYIEDCCGKEQEYLLGEKPLKTLRLNQAGRNMLLVDFKILPRKLSPLYREWEKWLKGTEPHLQMTFDANSAAENREAVFITPVHPLALQAANAIGNNSVIYSTVKVSNAGITAGKYPFAIYQWQIQGIRDDVVFMPVCDYPIPGENFMSLFTKAKQLDPSNVEMPEQNIFDTLHHKLWSDARAEHQAYNLQLAQYRKESLKSSHKGRLSIINKRLSTETDEKIRKMKQSEIAKAQADFERRMSDIEKAETQADITAQLVALGVMVVEG